MRTTVSTLANLQTALQPDRRALVAAFEYVKSPTPVLDPETGADTGETTDAATGDEIDAIFDAAAAKAAELGITVVWRAAVAQVPAAELANGETLALETVSTVVKTSPDGTDDDATVDASVASVAVVAAETEGGAA